MLDVISKRPLKYAKKVKENWLFGCDKNLKYITLCVMSIKIGQKEYPKERKKINCVEE